jgi:rhamnulokinase
VRAVIPDAELYGMTGIQFMPVNTLYQLVALADRHPALLAAADRLLLMPDLVSFFLVGEAAAEYTIASTSQFLNPASETWETRIFERLGLPVSLLPPLVRPGAVLGRLLPEQAADLGLPGLAVRACAAHDTASAVAAVPAQDDAAAWAFISSGTWSLVGVEIPRPLLSGEARLANATNEAGVCGTTRLLKNVTGLWLAQRLVHDLALREPGLDFSALAAAAAAAPAFQRFIAPNMPLFHNPPSMVDAIADFCIATGQAPPATPGEFARCIFESLAFSYAEVLAALTQLTGTRLGRVHIIGGGARNAFLNACAANACGIEVVAGPDEATAIGNGLVQAMADGIFGTLAQARQAVARSFPVTVYPPNEHEAWQRHFSRYQEIVQAAEFR